MEDKKDSTASNSAETLVTDASANRLHSSVKYVIHLKKIAAEIKKNSNNLSESNQLFLDKIEHLPLDYTGACDAYSLLNHYVRIQIHQLDIDRRYRREHASGITESIENKLNDLLVNMLNDSELNWFGVSDPDYLESTTSIYSGALFYNQSMQSMIVHIAQNLALVREKMSQNSDEGSLNLDMSFLEDYLQGNLSEEQITQLDDLGAQLVPYQCDYETIQAALHYYRFVVAAQHMRFQAISKWIPFMVPRSHRMAISNSLSELSKEELKQRIEGLIPEGPVKDYYNTVNSSTDYEPQTFTQCLQFMLSLNKEGKGDNDEINLYGVDFSGRDGGMITALHSAHYQRHMDGILNILNSTEFPVSNRIGQLPYYPAEKGHNRLVPVMLSKTSYSPGGHGGITNSEIHEMISEHMVEDKWEGETINKHQRRLFTISLLSTDFAVAEKAQRHHEFWYSNVTPFCRGSAAISEAFSKALLLSHGKKPGQMADFLPDLWAIFHDEEVFVTLYPQLYQSYSENPVPLLPLALDQLLSQLEKFEKKINKIVVFEEDKKEKLEELKQNIQSAYEALETNKFTSTDLKQLKQSAKELKTSPGFFNPKSEDEDSPTESINHTFKGG